MSQVLQQVLFMSPEERRAWVAENESALVEEMLCVLGDASQYVREQLNYQLLIVLLQQDVLSQQGVQQLVEGCAQRLEESDFQEEDVFGRSASVLFIASIVQYDAAETVLQEAQVQRVVEALIRLVEREKDGRGYVSEEAGWIDVKGISATSLVACMSHPHFGQRKVGAILQAVKQSCWNGVWVNNEDERFVRIIHACHKLDVDEDVLIEWVEQLFDRLEWSTPNTPHWFAARTNSLMLMKTLYFHLKFSRQYEKLQAIISIFIQRWM